MSTKGEMLKLKDTIIPIFCEHDNKMESEGSGVLLQISDQFFILSAAHTLDVGSLYIPNRDAFAMLNGFSKSSTAPNGDRKLDQIDIGYVHLQPDIVQNIKAPYWFLPTCLISINHTQSKEQHYMFMGYPKNAVKRQFGTKHFRSKLNTYIDKVASEKTYNGVNANQADHIVINFDHKQAKDGDGNLITPPKMKGMSGGGVWVNTTDGPLEGLPNTRLCGIGIEYYTKHHKCLVGTRIHHALELIRNHYPQLSDHIPRRRDRIDGEDK